MKGAQYSKIVPARHHAQAEQSTSSSKRALGSSRMVPLEGKKSARFTYKCTLTTWLHYYHGDFPFTECSS